jgi:hypothetical protein
MGHPHWNIFEWDHPEKKNGTCGIMISNLTRLKSVSVISSFTHVMNAASMMFIVLDGRTNRGRRLRLVFQDKGNGLVRVFTGWASNKKR